ncbi:MAG TPA: hypothetical protein VMF91_12910 [Bryobacteraceae bacterium]|nr:hypothetical protein [Bryobacteraceae bacterium]
MPLKTKLFVVAVAGLVCFVAPRLGRAQAQSVAGKWHFVLQTEGGERTADPNFQQDGDQITGKWGDAEVKGTFSGSKLDLAFPYNSDEAGPGTLKIKGELKGETLTGTWEFQEYTGSFKATRPASAP